MKFEIGVNKYILALVTRALKKRKMIKAWENLRISTIFNFLLYI